MMTAQVDATMFNRMATSNLENQSKQECFLHIKILEARTSHCLSLNNCKLTRIPPEVFTKLMKLKHIYLSGCTLRGKVPVEIGELTQLQTLDLSNNSFEEFPVGLCYQLNRITTLDVSCNRLVTLPSAVSEMKNLKELNLAQNRLVHLPKGLRNLSHLQILNVSSNLLRELPTDILIGSMSRSLRVLKLANNLLQYFPPEIGELTSLEELDIQNNNFTCLPASVKSLRKLKAFYYCGNRWKMFPPFIQGVPTKEQCSFGTAAVEKLYSYISPQTA